MTQASSNTIIYEQIMHKVLNFIEKYRNKEIYSKQDIVNEFNQIVSEINNSNNKPLLVVEQFIKGEPPSSEKLNRFLNSMRNDIEIISRQMDYLSAKTISVFNLFSEEIENSKFHEERIASKTKILQMYSNSPSKDIIYLGDSFENMDLIDTTRISTKSLPLVNNGSFTLPIKKSNSWRPNFVRIINSNGYLGNNHEAVKALAEDDEEVYSYRFESSRYSGLINSLTDNNPSTFLEVEKIKIDTSDIGNGLPNPDEFCYYVDSNLLSSGSTSQGVQKVSWNNILSEPLKFTVSFTKSSSDLANCVKIYPYFQNSLSVKVSEVLVFDIEGQAINVLTKPIYIGSSPVSYSYSEFSSYYHNYATVYFDEIRTSRVDIIFEQESHENILAKHMYWRPAYSGDNVEQSPFFGLQRFNPQLLSSEIQYNSRALVPGIKDSARIKTIKTRVNIPVTINPIVDSSVKYYLTLNAQKDGISTQFYFSSKENFNIEVMPGWNGFSVQDFDSSTESLIDFYINEQDAQDQLDSLIAMFDEKFQEDWEIGIGSPAYVVDKDSLRIDSFQNSSADNVVRINVPLSNEFEIRQAQRSSVGIRAIEILREEYADQAEIVSKPFEYDKSVETVMISLNYKNNKELSGQSNVSVFLSLGDTNQWVSISPIESSFVGIPEVLALNQKVAESYRIAGVSYINSPEIPESIKDIRVKIRITKDQNVNYTPEVYSYQLMTKVGL
jgi:hypothetical protein